MRICLFMHEEVREECILVIYQLRPCEKKKDSSREDPPCSYLILRTH